MSGFGLSDWAQIRGSRLPGAPGWDKLGPDGGPINKNLQTAQHDATTDDRKRIAGYGVAAARNGYWQGDENKPGDPAYYAMHPDDPWWNLTPALKADHDRFMLESRGYSWYTSKTTLDLNPLDAVERIPVVGDVVKIVGEAAAAPFQLAIAIGEGARLDHALVGALKEQLKIVKDVAPYAQTIVSFVPGLGTGVAMMIGAGAALAEGKSIDDVAEAAIRGALPGGPVAIAAFDAAKNIVKGENVTQAAIQSARDLIPPGVAQKAFDIGTAVVTGQKIQTALANGFMSLAPGQLQNIIAAGKAAVASVPGLSDALKTVAVPAQDGFHAAAAMLSSTGLNEKSLVALRNQLTPVLRQGFDAALKTQTKNIPWLANVTNAPATSAPNMADPRATTRAPTMADPKKKTVAYAPYPKKTGVGVGADFVAPALFSLPGIKAAVDAAAATRIQANAAAAQIAAAGTRHAPIMADPTPRTHAPVMADPRAHASSAYAPYPKAGVGVAAPWWDNWRDEWDDDIQSMKQMYGLAAPPPHGHPGGGHPFAARPHGHGGGQPDFWWGVPYSPETTDMACRTWGPAIEIPPPMQTAARVALNVSKGAPTTVRGPDNRLYLFSIENGQITARPCAN